MKPETAQSAQHQNPFMGSASTRPSSSASSLAGDATNSTNLSFRKHSHGNSSTGGSDKSSGNNNNPTYKAPAPGGGDKGDNAYTCTCRTRCRSSSTSTSRQGHQREAMQYLESTTADLMNGNFNLTVLHSVGSGYVGTVYKCLLADQGYDPPLESVVALKILSKEKVKAKVAASEAELLRSAKSLNVMKFLAAYEVLDSFWIITEYCALGDLHSRLSKLDKCHIMARDYMMDVINGLESLHEKLIVHADIKMRNILITEDNIAKIADFGFAKRYLSEDDRETVCHGTRDYWAPEMQHDCPNYNPFKADIYALGVTFVGVCERRPIKIKYDNIHHIVRQFKDQHQLELFKGILDSVPGRWSFDKIKSNLWLNEYQRRRSAPL